MEQESKKLKYSCFISYRHIPVQNKEAKELISELMEALKKEIGLLDCSYFFDENRLQGGDKIDEKLAHSVCSSACMILLFTPAYFESDSLYCTKEYIAMTQLQEEREAIIDSGIGDSAKGLIIPIVLRGRDELPKEISDKYVYYDFTGYIGAETFKDKESSYLEFIQEIAKNVRRWDKAFRNHQESVCAICGNFALPSTEIAKQKISDLNISPNSF